MNIVFAVQNNADRDSKISSVFGRAKGFILYSEETEKISYHSNTENVNTGHGAGIQAGQSVVNMKADVVITGGSIGPKAFEVLMSADIKTYTQTGEILVKEALENYKKGEYSETLKSDK